MLSGLHSFSHIEKQTTLSPFCMSNHPSALLTIQLKQTENTVIPNGNGFFREWELFTKELLRIPCEESYLIPYT